jgi:hypothetical protein
MLHEIVFDVSRPLLGEALIRISIPRFIRVATDDDATSGVLRQGQCGPKCVQHCQAVWDSRGGIGRKEHDRGREQRRSTGTLYGRNPG